MTAPLRERTMSMSVPWVIAEYPTPATAEQAGMTLGELEEFIFDAVLLDWDAEARRMRAIADLFDGTDTVRIVGAETDLTLSLAGRAGAVDDGHINMPGGEVFYSPIEDSADGVITFDEFPGRLLRQRGRRVLGSCSKRGCIVEATAREGEAFLLQTLDTDDGVTPAGRARHRLQPGHPALHEERRVRREDRRHGPSRGRQLVHVDGRQERELRSTGTSSRTSEARAGSTPTAGSCRKTAAGRSSRLHGGRSSARSNAARS